VSSWQIEHLPVLMSHASGFESFQIRAAPRRKIP
jgi:hypothetical protein